VASKLTRALHGYQTTQEQVSLARFGGDEFVILVRHADARSVAMTIAATCCAEFREPIAHEGLEFYSAPSIGLAVYPEDGGDVATVLKHADTAMYQAKNGASSGVAVYSAAMSSHLRDWLDLEAGCGGPFRKISCNCNSSQNSGCATIASPASKACCAGTTPNMATSRPAASSKSPKTAVSSSI